MKIKIALGKGNTSNTVVNKEFGYDEFKKTICGFRKVKASYDDNIAEIKSKLTWFIAGEFSPAIRKTENLLTRSCIVLDVDSFKGSIKKLEEKVQSDLPGLKYMCYSTASHTPDAPKIRIIVFLKESIKTEHYNNISRQFVKDKISFADAVDTASYKPNQFMYVASDIAIIDAPEELCYQKWFMEGDGELLNTEKYNKQTLPKQLPTETSNNNVFDFNYIPVGTERVKHYLNQYPANKLEFQEWVEVGMMIHHNYQGSEEGYRIFDEWNALDKNRYDEQKNRKHWQSFKDKPKIKTFASIIYKVNQQGDANTDWKYQVKALINNLSSDNFTEQSLKEIIEMLAQCSTAIEAEPYLDTIKDRTKVLLPHLRSMLNKSIKERTLNNKDKYEGMIFDIKNPLPPELFTDYMDNDKPPKTTLPNFNVILKNYGITIRRNLISREEEINMPGQTYCADTKLNASYIQLVSICEMNGVNKNNLINGYCNNIGSQNVYNPALDLIKSKPWDGKNRLQDILDTIVIKKGYNENLKNIIVKKWLISAVAVLCAEKGTKTKGVLILQGGQSARKNFWFERLVPKALKDFYMEGLQLNTLDKDSVAIANSCWIVELGEFEGSLTGRQMSSLKAFFSNDKSVLRRAYAAKNEIFYRRSAFCGSVNPQEFLKDRTGNVRYWAIAVEILLSTDHIDKQQFWAEILSYYEAGQSWYLTSEEEKMLEESNEHFLEVCPYEEVIRQYLKPYSENIKNCPESNKKTATDILVKIKNAWGLNINIDQRGTRAVVNALNRLGFQRECGFKKRFYIENI